MVLPCPRRSRVSAARAEVGVLAIDGREHVAFEVLEHLADAVGVAVELLLGALAPERLHGLAELLRVLLGHRGNVSRNMLVHGSLRPLTLLVAGEGQPMKAEIPEPVVLLVPPDLLTPLPRPVQIPGDGVDRRHERCHRILSELPVGLLPVEAADLVMTLVLSGRLVAHGCAEEDEQAHRIPLLVAGPELADSDGVLDGRDVDVPQLLRLELRVLPIDVVEGHIPEDPSEAADVRLPLLLGAVLLDDAEVGDEAPRVL